MLSSAGRVKHKRQVLPCGDYRQSRNSSHRTSAFAGPASRGLVPSHVGSLEHVHAHRLDLYFGLNLLRSSVSRLAAVETSLQGSKGLFDDPAALQDNHVEILLLIRQRTVSGGSVHDAVLYPLPGQLVPVGRAAVALVRQDPIRRAALDHRFQLTALRSTRGPGDYLFDEAVVVDPPVCAVAMPRPAALAAQSTSDSVDAARDAEFFDPVCLAGFALPFPDRGSGPAPRFPENTLVDPFPELFRDAFDMLCVAVASTMLLLVHSDLKPASNS